MGKIEIDNFLLFFIYEKVIWCNGNSIGFLIKGFGFKCGF